MESEGSDQRQDILAPLHLGPHTAAGTSAGSSASCQSHHTTRDQQADDSLGSFFITCVCVCVVKAAGNSPDFPQTPLLLMWELGIQFHTPDFCVQLLQRYVRASLGEVGGADVCGPDYSHTQHTLDVWCRNSARNTIET